MAALPGDLEAQLFKYADCVALAYTRDLWHGSNSNQFAGETGPVGFSLTAGILLCDFQPELDGLPDVGQRFIVSGPLAMTTRQSRTGNGEALLGFDHDNLILHGEKIL